MIPTLRKELLHIEYSIRILHQQKVNTSRTRIHHTELTAYFVERIIFNNVQSQQQSMFHVDANYCYDVCALAALSWAV